MKHRDFNVTRSAASCVLALGVLVANSAISGGESEEPHGAARAYKIIYNWDGAPHGYSQYPQTLEQFLEKTFAPLKNTQVEALFWCIGEHEAAWKSKTLPLVGSGEKRVYSGARSMAHHENIRAMLARGENPYQAMVKRGKELGIDVFLSIRMNDNHFSGMQLDEMANANHAGLTDIRKQHPEWCLGPKNAPPWFALSWNMAIPEVREHRFLYISEAIAQADWDGIELDWQRHAFHLPANDAWRLRYTLTDLQRAVRQHTDAIARRRGRPFPVSIRVATTLEACKRIGYDLKTWVNERLFDILVTGGGAGTDPGSDVEGFRKLLHGTGIRFYAGFDGGFWGEYRGLNGAKEWTEALFRGYSKAFWEREASGIYVFNWHANDKTRRALLRSIGAVKSLRGQDKVFAALHRNVRAPGLAWSGADLNDRLLGETPTNLYRSITRSGPTFSVDVYDDVANEASAGRVKKVQLCVELGQWAPGDVLQFSLDGQALGPPTVRTAVGDDPLDPGEVSDHTWFVWPLNPGQADRGSHSVRITLSKRDPRLKPPLSVERVEIHVDYR